MAFRAPTHRPAQRPHLNIPVTATAGPSTEQQLHTTPQRKRPLEESEWILFSPSAAASSSARTPTERLSRVTTASRFTELGSQLGSLETEDGQQSSDAGLSDVDERVVEEAVDLENVEVEAEPSELDSLDDGLHAFHEEIEGRNTGENAAGSYALPTHDGLGEFQFPAPNLVLQPNQPSQVQEQMWAFERYTPRKRPQVQNHHAPSAYNLHHLNQQNNATHRRRRSSVQKTLDLLEQDSHFDRDAEKRRRIENWRLEQSKALLEEIERVTRRRRQSGQRTSSNMDHSVALTDEEDKSDSELERSKSARVSNRTGQGEAEDEGFWARITRRVIRDLMGIDDEMLSVIFGEDLPASSTEELSTTPTPDHPGPHPAHQSGEPARRREGWEQRLLNRLARELGALVSQMEEQDGRAFSTYPRASVISEHIPYLGASEIEERATTPTPTTGPFTNQAENTTSITPTENTSALFQPTVPVDPTTNNVPDASLWGIEEEPLPTQSAEPPTHASTKPQPIPSRRPISSHADKEREYWERDLDARSLFRFLLRRFSSRPSSPARDVEPRTPRQRSPAVGPTGFNTSVLAEPGPRAAYIRRTHPLTHTKHASHMSHRDRIEKRGSFNAGELNLGTPSHSHASLVKLTGVNATSALTMGLNKGKGQIRRGGSSCASQSQSGRSVSLGSAGRSGKRRNFWEGPGSGVGSWGEV